MNAVHITADEAANRAGSCENWGSQVWMADRPLTGSSLALARLIITAGHSREAHRHPNADEVVYFVRGRVAVHAGSETFLLEPGDALAIPAGLPHRIENIGTEDAEMILSYSTGDREYLPESAAKRMWTRITDWYAHRRFADVRALGPPP